LWQQEEKGHEAQRKIAEVNDVKILVALVGLIFLMGVCCWVVMIRMPGRSYRGSLPLLGQAEAARRDELRRHVEQLAGEIGERNVIRYDRLSAAADYLQQILEGDEYEVQRQEFAVPSGFGSSTHAADQTRTCYNLEVQIEGAVRPDEIVVVGAHYDSAPGTPGANDNATGTAAVLALAHTFAGRTSGRTLRFVLFTNEEPPHFHTPSMGSLVYAKRCQVRREQVVAMVSLETIGYFSDEPGSQKYPFPIGLFYPSTGDFVGFVGNISSRRLVHRAIRSFRAAAKFPSRGVAAPGSIPGIDWSDHWSFWQAGYSGIMVTDTAPFRYEHYHTADDTADKIDYDRLARVVTGMEMVIEDLVSVQR
jgi:hypothetical protein